MQRKNIKVAVKQLNQFELVTITLSNMVGSLPSKQGENFSNQSNPHKFLITLG